MADDDLTVARLKELLHYDPLSGLFTRLHSGRTYPRRPGRYLILYIDRRQYQSHRVAFLYMTGAWPQQCVDHINGDPSDNRWVNLRDVSIDENNRNRRFLFSTKLPGAYRDGKRWVAQIGMNGRSKRLGRFDTAEEAHQAFLRAKAEWLKQVASEQCVKTD